MKQEIRIEDLSIVTKRRFAYGVRKVWRMWSELALIERWWGPDGFTTTTESFEFAVGGRWIFTMNGPDGTKYPNEVEFKSIDPHASIRYEHVSAPPFKVSVEFAAISAEATEVTFTMVFETKEQRDAVRVYAEPANEQFMDKLDRAAKLLP